MNVTTYVCMEKYGKLSELSLPILCTDVEVNGYTFSGSYSSVFFIASLFSGSQCLKERLCFRETLTGLNWGQLSASTARIICLVRIAVKLEICCFRYG